MVLPKKKTKIVCTIGPASESPELICRLLEEGMNVARLNFSHGDFGTHKKVIDNLRAASARMDIRLAIIADLPGPKIRIGRLAFEPIELKQGDSFTLTIDDIVGDNKRVSISFAKLPAAVKAGDTIYLNDGYIHLEVLDIQGSDIRCNVKVGGELRSRKGLNLPNIDLGISAFTERDRECLKFALDNGVDAVSQSFVENANDIHEVREAANALGYQPFVIAKIERANAIANIDDILEAADGIMIARGDLGVEVPIERIAVVQKDLVRRANMKCKPVITATQMLESMIANKLPTRAEATDVSNAIMNGSDCVMLSGESAMGKYPVESVKMLTRIAATVEPERRRIPVGEMFDGITLGAKIPPARLIDLSVETVLRYASPAAVFVPTRSGVTARSIGRFKLPVWIVAVSSQEATCQNLQFSYGVYPVLNKEHPENWKSYVKNWLLTHNIWGDFVVLTEGPSTKHPDENHRMEIIDLRSL